MSEGSLILNVCFSIVLVATSPIPQEVNAQAYPGIDCYHNAFRNSLIGLLNGELTSDKTPELIKSICPSQDKLLKILDDRIISKPSLVDIINDIQLSNYADITNNMQNPRTSPNIVNNYIILPPDLSNGIFSNIKGDSTSTECIFNNPNICKRVKKNTDKNRNDLGENDNYNHNNEAVVVNRDKSQLFVITNQNISDDRFSNSKMSPNITTSNQKSNTKKSSKRPSQTKGERNYTLKSKNIGSSEVIFTENGNQVVNKTSNLKTKAVNEIKPPIKQSKNCEELKDTGNVYKNVENNDKNREKNKLLKPTSSRKIISGITIKHEDQENDNQVRIQTDEAQKKRLKSNDHKPKEKQPNRKDDNKNKQKVSDTIRPKNTYNSVPVNQDYRFSNVPYDSTTMYKYIDAIMSNYQLSNNDYKHDFPFNFQNFYQFPQLSNTWNSKKSSRTKSYKRRKHPKFYRRKHNRKRVFSRKKPAERKILTESVNEINPGFDVTTPSYTVKENPRTNIIKKDSETITIIENVLEQKNNISREEKEKENSVTTIFDELSLINNSLSEETNYNSYPSFVNGMDDKVPIIFENSLMDDYYPDFTADETLQLTQDTHPIKYHGDKYNYVSNQNFDFGDFIKKRKRIAMKNMNKHFNLFFSETEGHQNLTSNQETKGAKEKLSTIQFKSPPFLDNPDFRTRKIDSNEIYEPYDYHDIYRDHKNGFNKYYVDDKAVVYSTPISAKDNAKTKSCNDIQDGLTKRKTKDSSVETIHARSKLAKYGLTF